MNKNLTDEIVNEDNLNSTNENQNESTVSAEELTSETENFENAEASETEEVENDSEEISFEDLGLDEITLKAIEKKGFVTPSPIQVLAIPRLLNGDANVIARARTGTGKTAAFGLPLVQSLRNESNIVKAVILEPTRELAMQTCTEMASFTTGTFPRTTVVYGGASIGEQIRQLRRGCEIVVGTPGRVQDLIERGVLDLSHIEYFILDEGDEMLDMGFVEDIENIFASANPESRILLFSATIPSEILKIAQKFMGEYEIVEEEGIVEEPLLIDQKYWIVRQNEKIEALVRLIDIAENFYGLVFVQKKTDADFVCKALDEKGYEVAALHGDIPQGQREKILTRFRNGKTRILVATDVAARGIDIEGLTHVVNYELPFDGPTYVHRIGRTGRAGSSGMAVTFVRPEERRKLQYLKAAIKRSAKGDLNEGKVPSVEEVLNAKQSRLFAQIKKQMGISDEKAEVTAEVSSEAENQNTESQENVNSEVSTEAAEEKRVAPGNPIFTQLAEELCKGQNPQDVVASLLCATYGKELSRRRYGKVQSYDSFSDKGGRDGSSRSRGGRRDKPVTVRNNQIRVYVQMGWKDGYNPKKIADYFSSLLHIAGKDVDAIDMADKFCLLNLPKEAGYKVIEMSKADAKLPHIHQDTKVEFSGRDEGRRSRDEGRRGESRYSGRDRSERGEGRNGRSSRDRSSSRRNEKTRANVHTATKRSSKAALFKKGNAGDEY